MRLILLAAVWLIVATAIRANDDEEATVEEVPNIEKAEEMPYTSPTPKGNVYFAEHFDDHEDFEARWVRSQAKKEDIDEEIAKYDGKWAIEAALKDSLKGDFGLVLKSKAKHAAISASLDRPFQFTNKPLIVQYDVTFQNGQECGGAYIKLLTQENGMRLSQFRDKTPYTIMFGPDKCGNDHKLHFIFRHKNPKDGSFSEKHAKKPAGRLEDYFKDGKPHLYTLAIYPDNTFEAYVDYKVINKGSLLDDFTPPVNPPAEIDDPEDHKPEDWDEREKIPDPDAKKPDDWDEDEPEQIPDDNAVKPEGWLDDEPETIPDPSAEKPDDWDEDMDGTWEAPLIDNPACKSAPGCGQWKPPMKSNPKYKGKWRPAMIDNPNYKGKWRPRRIPNPDFFEDLEPFKMSPIGAVGLELWSMSDNILFDNMIITDDKHIADEWAADTFELKMSLIKKEQLSIWEQLKRPKYLVRKLSRWTSKNDWFWMLYGTMAFAPVIAFVIYLFLWSRGPDDDDQSWKTTIRRWINRKSNAIMVYAMYLSLPATLYIWFLRRRVIEESFVQRVVSYTNKTPWLWAAYVVIIGLPLVLIFTFCCGNSKEKQEQARAAKAKKTDEPVEDDEGAEGAEEDGQLNEGESAAPEEGEEVEEGDDGEDGEDVEDVDAEGNEPAEEEPEQTHEEEQEPVEEAPQPKGSPRRRKVRKD